MKKFLITTSVPAVQYYSFTVEAETEQDAIDKVFSGDVEPYNSELELSGYDDEEVVRIREAED